MEELEPDTDDDIIDITNISERPANDRRSPQLKQNFTTHTTMQGHCLTPQSSPMYLVMNAAAVTPAKPHRTEIWACLRKQPPRVTFKYNDISIVNDEESDIYEEPNERQPRVMYKLKVNEYPTSKNMPHEEEFDDIIMNPLMKQQYEDPLFQLVKYSM